MHHHRGVVKVKMIFGKDEKGKYHIGEAVIRIQKNGKAEVLCPCGHLLFSDLDIFLAFEYYKNKTVKCYGKVSGNG